MTEFKLLIENFNGNPLNGKKYTLDVDGVEYEGVTSSTGFIEHKVDAQAMIGKITIWLDDKKKNSIIWPLELGSLDPHDDNAGVQARLNNIGYNCGKVDGKIDKKPKKPSNFLRRTMV